MRREEGQGVDTKSLLLDYRYTQRSTERFGPALPMGVDATESAYQL